VVYTLSSKEKENMLCDCHVVIVCNSNQNLFFEAIIT